MSKNYTHLSQEQRYQIEALLKAGHRQNLIAKMIGTSPSTVSRELKRNIPQGGVGSFTYWATNAQRRTDLRHRDKEKFIRFASWMKHLCRDWLKNEKYSPELMSAEGKRLHGDFVSHETIYKWIWRCKKSNRTEDRQDKKLYLKLRHNPRRQKRGTRHDKRGNIPHRIMIDKRPSIVNKRKRIGDLEVDLMIGKMHRSAILVSLDRSTLKVKLRKVRSKESSEIKNVLINAYRNQNWVRTITFDNDSAFMQHLEIGQSLCADTYFTRPYTSQDKGSVENRIGILRRFLPKKSDLSLVSVGELRRIENKLNNRPVRKFNYKTPNQVFSEKIALTG
jgi:transposase, IS30 family